VISASCGDYRRSAISMVYSFACITKQRRRLIWNERRAFEMPLLWCWAFSSADKIYRSPNQLYVVILAPRPA